MKKVEIYTTQICPYCVRAKKMLSYRNIAYQEIKINSAEQMQEMITRAGGRRTVPQIFIDDQHIGGSDDLFEYFKNIEK